MRKYDANIENKKRISWGLLNAIKNQPGKKQKKEKCKRKVTFGYSSRTRLRLYITKSRTIITQE